MSDDDPKTNPATLPPEVASVLDAVRRDAVVAQLREVVEAVGDLQAALAPVILLSTVCLAVLDREIGIPRLGSVRLGTLGGLVGVLLALLGTLALFGVDATTANRAALGWCEGLGVCDHVEVQCVDALPMSAPPGVLP